MPPRPDVVDLRILTDRWRVKRDGEGQPVILGRRGAVSAHETGTLCVLVRGRRFLLGVLRGLPGGWRRHQVGDDEANLLAPLADLDRACELVRAYRRRQLTDEQRAALAERARTTLGAGAGPRETGGFVAPESAIGLPTEATHGSDAAGPLEASSAGGGATG